jgi:Ribosome biogenesis protein SLX9
LESCATEEPLDTLTKKEKHRSKKEAFLQRMNAIALLSLHIALTVLRRLDLESPLPYSKSHSRRLRRKAKEQIIGGDLNDLQSAIAALDDDHATDGNACVDGGTHSPSKSIPDSRPKPGKIGEGKKNPLSKSQRKHALYVAALALTV